MCFYFLYLPAIAFCLGISSQRVSVNGTVNTRALLGFVGVQNLRALRVPAAARTVTQLLCLQISGVSGGIGNVNPTLTLVCAAVGSAKPALNGSVMVGNLLTNANVVRGSNADFQKNELARTCQVWYC